MGIAQIVKSIGLPVVSDGYVIDYIVNGKWRHFSGVMLINGTNEHPEDLEFVTNVIERKAEQGITRQNVSHVTRIFDYDGDPPELEKACTDIKLLEEVLGDHQYKIIIVNKELFIKFCEEE